MTYNNIKRGAMKNQEYDELKVIVDNYITNMLCDIDKASIKYNTTIIKKIISEAITSHNTGFTCMSSKINSMFSGRGRAWAKTNVDVNNVVWSSIKHTLNESILYAELGSTTFNESSNLLDIFESAGFAWMRFSSAYKNKIRFQLRTKGSKLEHHINFSIENFHLFNGNITNLEDVPHRIGLEPGVFKVDQHKPQKTEEFVSKDELRNFGIQTLEEVLEEDYV